MPELVVWIGFDPRESDAFAVALSSMRRYAILATPVHGLDQRRLRRQGIYTRPQETRNGGLWDPISQAPMSTEFALTRFLVPSLQSHGWALFVDADVMFRVDVRRILRHADPRYAVMVVKHEYSPPMGQKMDGQLQVPYARKNWSSVMLFNCQHPANKGLTRELVNSARGLDLHQFCWLSDDEIGELPEDWNWLEGHSNPMTSPSIVHFTEGVPRMLPGRTMVYANEWWAELEEWSRAW